MLVPYRKKKLCKAYQEFFAKMKEKGSPNLASTAKDLLELGNNPQTGKFDEKSIGERGRGWLRS